MFERRQYNTTELRVLETDDDKFRRLMLCYQCEHFKPEKPRHNCKIHTAILADSRQLGKLVVVWDCDEFEFLSLSGAERDV